MKQPIFTNDDGELVVEGYPTNSTQGEMKSLAVRIGSQQHDPVDDLLVELQRVRT